MEWIWKIALKKAAVNIITVFIAYLSSEKVVSFFQMLAEKGFHVQITVDQSTATLTTVGLLTVLRNYVKFKTKASFL